VGSVDLDEAMRLAFPNDPRWDYAIGISQRPDSDRVVWLEVHPASSLHVDEVLNKLRWLKGWRAKDAPELRRLPAHFCWVATGTVSFRRGSREEKRIAQEGIRFPGKALNLDEFRFCKKRRP
jgi:hypothetical protein